MRLHRPRTKRRLGSAPLPEPEKPDIVLKVRVVPMAGDWAVVVWYLHTNLGAPTILSTHTTQREALVHATELDLPQDIKDEFTRQHNRPFNRKYPLVEPCLTPHAGGWALGDTATDGVDSVAFAMSKEETMSALASETEAAFLKPPSAVVKAKGSVLDSALLKSRAPTTVRGDPFGTAEQRRAFMNQPLPKMWKE